MNPDSLEEHSVFLSAISPALSPRILSYLLSQQGRESFSIGSGGSEGQLLCPLLCVVLALQTLMLSEHVPPTLQLPPCQPWAEKGVHHFWVISLNGYFLPGEVFPGDFLHICCGGASAHGKQHKQELYILKQRKLKLLPETDQDGDG